MSDSAVARIWCGRTVVGAGFPVASDILLTCAHVVSDALGLPRDAVPSSTDKVEFDFPISGAGKKFSATVERWRPFERDIAVLRVEPAIASPRRPLRLAPPERQVPCFTAFGFPARFPQGRNEKGVIFGPAVDGLVEIRPESGDAHKYFVEQGFSGTPAIVDDQVIGMVVATGPVPQDRLAYLLPIADLERAWPPLAQPYRGLAAFDEQSARWFRGRTEFVERILGKLDTAPVVAIVGASGSGKSSIVKAGVVPNLRRRGWLIASCRIGDRPLNSLSRALVPLLYPGRSRGEYVDSVHELEKIFERSVADAWDHVDALLTDTPGLFIVLDQFEELITLASEDDRQMFDNVIAALIKRGATKGLRIAITLRSDYVDAIEHLDCARLLLNDAQIRLTPMNRHELADAVQGPARDLGVSFVDGIDGDLIGQVMRTPSLLPLLQYTLQELWRHQKNQEIDEAALNLFGGLEGVLGRRADDVLEQLSEADREAARALFTTHLVVLAEGGVAHDTKRAATQNELGEKLWNIAQAFAAEGVWLLVIARDADGKSATVEILHEALIRNWENLARWLDEVRSLRLWEAGIRRQMLQNVDPNDDIWLHYQVEEAQQMLLRSDVDLRVRDYALGVLARTEAAELWSQLRDYQRFDETVDLLPEIANPVRDAMIDRLQRKTECADAFLRAPVAIGYGLFGLDPERKRRIGSWVSAAPGADESTSSIRARCLLGIALQLNLCWETLIEAVQVTTNDDQCAALGQALAALAPSLSDPEAIAESLIAALRATINLNQCAALGQALAALAPRLSDPEARADSLIAALRATTHPDQCAALGQALAALAPSLSDPEARADSLIAALDATTDPDQSTALGQALAALVRLGDPEARAESLIAALRATTDRDQCTALGQALAALAPGFSDPDARADGLIAALRATTDRGQCAAFGQVLTGLAPSLSDPEARADSLIAALHATTDQGQCAALGQVLTGLAPSLTDPEARAASVIAALHATTDQGQCEALGQVLAALAPSLSDPEARADSVIAALHATTDYDQCAALGQALAALAPSLSDPEARADSLVAALQATTDPDQCAALGQALAALAPSLSDPEARADSLIAALHATTDPDQCTALGQALAALAPGFSDPEARTVSLIAVLQATTDPDQSAALGQALAALAPRLNDPEARAESLIVAMHATTDPDQSAALGQALAALAPRLTDPEARADSLIAVLQATTSPSKCAASGQALAALAPSFSDPEARADSLIAALHDTTDRGQCAALGQALAALAPRLSDPEACADSLIAALHDTTDRGQCAALGQAVVALAPSLSDPETHADSLIAALHATTSPSKCAALGQALAALAPRLSDPEARAESLIAVLRATTHPDQCAALGRALAALAPRLSNPEARADSLIMALCLSSDAAHAALLSQAVTDILPQLTNANRLGEFGCWAKDVFLASHTTYNRDRIVEVIQLLVSRFGFSDTDVINLFGILRRPIFRSTGGDGRRGHFGSMNFGLSSLASALMAICGTKTVWEAMEVLSAALPRVDLARPWPAPLVDPAQSALVQAEP